MVEKYICILVVLISSVVYTEQALDGFTDAEIQRLFHRSRKNLPKYETATLTTPKEHRSKREVRPVEFEVDGNKIQLHLTPIEYNSVSIRDIPVWTVETDYKKPTRHAYKKLDQKEIDFDGTFYEDKEKMALLLAYYKNRYIYYDGVFGESEKAKVVRSMPEKWWEVSSNKSHVDHVIFDVNEDKTDSEAVGETEPTPDSGELEEPLDVFYPKLLLIIEYNYFQSLGKNVSETIRYVSTFWNAVNLKYSKLSSPKIKIVITGIIIAKDHTALEYIYAARIPPEMTKVNNMKLINGGGKYFSNDFKKEIDFHNYDATITMSSLDTGATVGTAYIGEICGTTLNVGFFNDDASFSGILPATHELGHLLALPHDGVGRAKECDDFPDDKTGLVMAPYMVSVEKYVWSECSKQILHRFASRKKAECMRYDHRREN